MAGKKPFRLPEKMGVEIKLRVDETTRREITVAAAELGVDVTEILRACIALGLPVVKSEPLFLKVLRLL